nr:Gag_pre-integrs domain-containing protein/UBN2_2 domain-containing protein [Tanacetum cinerariifolium]
LANIDVDIEDEDEALILLTSLQYSYDNFVKTLLYERDLLTLEDVLSTLSSRELKKRTYKNDGDGLYLRGSPGYDKGDLLMAVSEERFLEWIMDSSCSDHMACKKDDFYGGTVLLDDNRACTTKGQER